MKFVPNLTFLLYFFSAGQAKSISVAAKENFVSQSAISQAISKLEIAFGRQLITHEKNKFQLTSEGLILLEKCKAVFQALTEIDDAFHETEGVYKGKFSFACTHSFALSFLPPYLKTLSHLWPNVEPILRLGHTGVIADLVKKGEVDFGIVLDNEDFSTFHTREIYRGHYSLYQAKKISKGFSNRFILSEERREISLLRQYLVDLDIEINSCMEVSSWEVIASLTEQGLGIGFMPDYMAQKHSLIPKKYPIPSIDYRILAISSKNRPLPRNAKMFIEIMKHD